MAFPRKDGDFHGRAVSFREGNQNGMVLGSQLVGGFLMFFANPFEKYAQVKMGGFIFPRDRVGVKIKDV